MASNLPSNHRLLVQIEVCPLNLSDRWHILPFLHSRKTSLFPHSALQIGHQELPFLTQLLFSFCFPPFSKSRDPIRTCHSRCIFLHREHQRFTVAAKVGA